MSGFIFFFLILLYALTCLFVIVTILLQSGKGGGLSSLGSGAGALSDSLGATGAEKTLVKATSWAAGIFLVLSMLLTIYGSHLERTGGGLVIGGGPPPTVETVPAPAVGTEAPVGQVLEVQPDMAPPSPDSTDTQ